MRHALSLTFLALAFLAIPLFTVSTSSTASAQILDFTNDPPPVIFDIIAPETGLLLDNREAWEAALSETNVLVEDGFESLVSEDGTAIDIDATAPLFFMGSTPPLANPQQLPEGELSFSGATFGAGLLALLAPEVPGLIGLEEEVAVIFGNDGLVVPTMTPTLSLDLAPEAGKLEGLFSLSLSINSRLRFFLFDGDTLVETYDEPALDVSTATDSFPTGWVNTECLNVTRIEIQSLEDNRADGFDVLGNAALLSLCFAFEPVEEPAAETCFDLLTDVRSDVDALLATATGRDAYLLGCVLGCIDWTQDDVFWVQPSGDRLTAYGSNVFLGTAYSIAYLEKVSDPQADVIIDELIAVLECLVDREIEYAMANGGRQANIDKAFDLAELAEIIDDDFDNEVVSSLAYRLAWLNAFYATY